MGGGEGERRSLLVLQQVVGGGEEVRGWSDMVGPGDKKQPSVCYKLQTKALLS